MFANISIVLLKFLRSSEISILENAINLRKVSEGIRLMLSYDKISVILLTLLKVLVNG